MNQTEAVDIDGGGDDLELAQALMFKRLVKATGRTVPMMKSMNISTTLILTETF